ncbi:uncharacterized protein RJT20DRAFT_136659 [Scheffersomyces xylosifermentans]|uniref:uncharacterized protein n=1 Tax=Scheffersomyces xylosifermentans TaxID=1304137 RepID=UPI00315D78F2
MYAIKRTIYPSYIASRTYSTSSGSTLNHYDILDVPLNASIKDIKVSFKKLSKRFHPDLNTHLEPEEKEANNSKFVEIVSAYETLKDIKKKKQYDIELRAQGNLHGGHGSNRPTPTRSEWDNKYYGEAKYYSRSGGQTTSASGLNSKRHRVYNASSQDDNSHFSGKHVNYGDRFDVPHFDYNEHLSKHLKFEQRMINKHISAQDREKIIAQLSKSGENLSEELITKHLMRHVHHFKGGDTDNYGGGTSSSSNMHATSFPRQGNNQTNTRNPHMYHGPQVDDSESGAFKTFMLLGGAGGSLFLLYKALF